MKLRTFWQFSFEEKIVFCLSFFLSGLIRIIIRISTYAYLSTYFGQNHQMLIASTLPSPKQLQSVLSLRRIIILMARYTPWHCHCLTQALVAKFWCQWHKIPYFFFIGLPKEHINPLGAEAHAWVTSGPIAITGGLCFDTHQVIRSYSNIDTSHKHPMQTLSCKPHDIAQSIYRR